MRILWACAARSCVTSSSRRTMARPAERGLAPLEACGRPELLRVVVGVEGRDRFRQPDPGQLGPGVDMHVRRDGGGIIERAAPDEQDFGPAAVLAPDRHLARGAPEDPIRAAAVERHGDRLWY